MSGSATVLSRKGNPLLGSFKILMRRNLEAGILERFWADLQHAASLISGKRERERERES